MICPCSFNTWSQIDEFFKFLFPHLFLPVASVFSRRLRNEPLHTMHTKLLILNDLIAPMNLVSLVSWFLSLRRQMRKRTLFVVLYFLIIFLDFPLLLLSLCVANDKRVFALPEVFFLFVFQLIICHIFILFLYLAYL